MLGTETFTATRQLIFATTALLCACVTQVEPSEPPSPAPPASKPAPAHPAEPQSTSCQAGGCGAGEYCASPTLGCGQSPDTTCKAKPDICTREYMPVCGCDGKTYGNRCGAAAAGQNVASKGACEAEPLASCGGIAGKACPKGSKCVDNPNDSCDPSHKGADCIGMCIAGPDKPPATSCQPVRCRMFCQHGWQKGPDGCEICACKPAP